MPAGSSAFAKRVIMNTYVQEVEFGGRRLTLETGRMAKQAHGAVLVTYGDTVVLVTACFEPPRREGGDRDFLPLTVDYQIKTFAAGKIPGGFFKREGRPSSTEILYSRLIDRPVRPLFPDNYRHETQIIATLLSLDLEHDPSVCALIGASAALEISPIPFQGPIAGVRVGRVDGRLICNPSVEEQSQGDLDILMAGSRDAVVMVEGGAQGVSEDAVMEALFFGQESMQSVLDAQGRMREDVGKPKLEVEPAAVDEELKARVEDLAREDLRRALATTEKLPRYEAVDAVLVRTMEGLGEEYQERRREVAGFIGDMEKEMIRGAIIVDGRRLDGRGTEDVRELDSQVGLLPRTHGSALFTRGETQALVTTTLGTRQDEQKIDALEGEYYKPFMLHYNFPPYCVGEVKFLRSPGRREIGHGMLAERAITAVLPNSEEFPYTLRIVSEVLESNGSSSMATVCGSSLALMDAGVPIKESVAGIAMGLIKEGDEVRVLSDILGDEDHVGDMDFKVAGSRQGVTAIQMDIKVKGLDRQIMRQALEQARRGRLHILDHMDSVIGGPRAEISVYAPKIISLKIHPDKIRDVIGPGGKIIRAIVEDTGAKIDVEDDGTVNIFSVDGPSGQKALEMIEEIVQEAEVGKLYMGVVKRITDFGAFVEIFPGTDGLLHISQLDRKRVNSVRDILKEGDEVLVKCIEVDRANGRIRLSRKEALGMTLEQQA